MKVFVYQASLYCFDCGQEIRKELDRAGKRPENVEDETTYDSGDYPKGPYGNGGGEADYPHHCDDCKVFLENPLTDDGYQYVIGTLRDSKAEGGTLSESEEGWMTFYNVDDDDLEDE